MYLGGVRRRLNIWKITKHSLQVSEREKYVQRSQPTGHKQAEPRMTLHNIYVENM